MGEAEAKLPTYGAQPWAVLAPPLRSQRFAH
jgi:hypothetical protein